MFRQAFRQLRPPGLQMELGNRLGRWPERVEQPLEPIEPLE